MKIPAKNKRDLFKELGFRFNPDKINKDFNYGNLVNAIELGYVIGQISESLGLNTEAINRLLIKLAMHKLKQEVYNELLIDDHLNIMDEFFDEEIYKDFTFSDLRTELFLISPDDFYDIYGDTITKHIKELKGKENTLKEVDIARLFEERQDLLKKEGSLAALYINLAKRFKKPLTKRASKRTRRDLIPFAENTEIFLNILSDLKGFDVLEDLINFESKTQLLFTLKASLLIEHLIEENLYDDEILKLISAISIVCDPKMKIELLNNLQSEGIPQIDILLGAIFKWEYIVIPLLVDFIRTALEECFPSSTLLPSNPDSIVDKTKFKMFKDVMKLAKYYKLLDERDTNDNSKILEEIKSIVVKAKNINASKWFEDIAYKLDKLKREYPAFEIEGVKTIISYIKLLHKYKDEVDFNAFLDLATVYLIKMFKSKVIIFNDSEEDGSDLLEFQSTEQSKSKILVFIKENSSFFIED